LLWNLIGVTFFITEWLAPELVTEAMTADQRSIYDSRPGWYLINYGTATITGVVACALLLAKRRIAVLLALISTICVLISTGFNISQGYWDLLNTSDQVTFLLVPILSLALYFYSRFASRKEWLL
jgi:hypothetical protein